MAIIFPNPAAQSPLNTFSPTSSPNATTNGVTYIWDGAKWTAAAPGSGSAGDVAAWVNFNGTGVVAIRASGNVSSITDNGTGDYTVNFTNAMPDTDYAVFGFIRATNAGSVFMSGETGSTTWQQTNSVRVVTLGTAGGIADSPYAFVSVVR